MKNCPFTNENFINLINNIHIAINLLLPAFRLF